MQDKKVTIKDRVHPDLLVSPHIMSELFQIAKEELRPDSSKQKQIVGHLQECEYCRTSLIVLLSAEQEYERLKELGESPTHTLLTQFVSIHFEIAIHDYEHMGAYAEEIKTIGRK